MKRAIIYCTDCGHPLEGNTMIVACPATGPTRVICPRCAPMSDAGGEITDNARALLEVHAMRARGNLKYEPRNWRASR